MGSQSLATPRVRELFLEHGRPRRFQPGELLLEKGAPADQVFFLTTGQVRTFCLNPSGEEISLFYLGPDSLIGSEALMSQPQVIVSVSAISPVELRSLPPGRLLQLWQEQKLPLQELIAHFIQRIALLSDYICCSHFLEDDRRVAYFLYTCCTASGPVIPYTHEQIAAITGMSRVSVSRILRKFREAGLLRQRYRRIHVLEPQQLAEVFHSLGYFLE